jgi:uncharacterized membrane protein YbhN (UPF0104 family)
MTTAKDIIIDFINLIFFLIIVGLTIIYFIAGDNFDNFRRFLESLAPFGGLSILFLLNFKFWREKAKKKEREGNFDLTLRLNFMDKLKSDIFIFSLPASSLLIIFIASGKVGIVDILAAGVVFILAYFWQKWLFSKERM